MTYTRGWLACLCSIGCAGIQGGTEGDGPGRCSYDTVAVPDPEATIEGFEASPHRLFSVAAAEFVGTVAGHDVRLHFEPDYSSVNALYDTNETPDCGPHLATTAAATLDMDAGNEPHVSTRAGLEIRWGVPLASATFDADPESSIASAIPTFQKPPLGSPTLSVWLTDLGAARVQSQWRWSALVACDEGDQCSGSPQTAQPNTGVEVDWGTADLTRN